MINNILPPDTGNSAPSTFTEVSFDPVGKNRIKKGAERNAV